MTAIISDRNKSLSWVCIFWECRGDGGVWESPKHWGVDNAWVSTKEHGCLAAQLAPCDEETIKHIIYSDFQSAVDDFIIKASYSTSFGEVLTVKQIVKGKGDVYSVAAEGYHLPHITTSSKENRSSFRRFLLLGFPNKKFDSPAEIIEKMKRIMKGEEPDISNKIHFP